MRLLTPATSHTYLARPGRLWSNLKAGVAQHRHVAEQVLASSSDGSTFAEYPVIIVIVWENAPGFGSETEENYLLKVTLYIHV